jgi:hypothetical protein
MGEFLNFLILESYLHEIPLNYLKNLSNDLKFSGTYLRIDIKTYYLVSCAELQSSSGHPRHLQAAAFARVDDAAANQVAVRWLLPSAGPRSCHFWRWPAIGLCC